MNRIVIKVINTMVVMVTLVACSNDEAPTSAQQQSKARQHWVAYGSELQVIADDYFEARLQLDPMIAPSIGDYRFNHQFGNNLTDEYLAESKKFAEKSLHRLSQVTPGAAGSEEKIDYAVVKWVLERDLRAVSTFPEHLMPFNQFQSRLNLFAAMGSGQSVQPMQTAEDLMAFSLKIEGFVAWVDTAIERMREGMRKNVVLPKALVKKILPQLEAHIVTTPEESVYWQPIQNLPKDFAQRAALEEVYRNAISMKLVPTYKKLHVFLKNEYLPKARSTSGYGDLPDGKAWYADLVKLHTTTSMTADNIHQIGFAEVARIHTEMNAVKKQVGFTGDLHAFFKHLVTSPQYFFQSPEEVLKAYQTVRARIDAVVPKFFDIQPEMNYEIRPVEAFRAASAAGAYYEPGVADGGRPGIFYINTHDLKAQPNYIVETLSLHEAVPGHHFQNGIQIGLKKLSKLRRFNGNTAYEEGWALYAESLGKEMGLFTDPYQYYGRLSDELLRAMRLVVDTGLHAKHWTREKAIQYMRDNSSMGDSDIEAEVERYMAIPGQALAYKIGEMKIRQLRTDVERELGKQFALSDFHGQVLVSGNMPLDALEDKIHGWVALQKSVTTETPVKVEAEVQQKKPEKAK